MIHRPIVFACIARRGLCGVIFRRIHQWELIFAGSGESSLVKSVRSAIQERSVLSHLEKLSWEIKEKLIELNVMSSLMLGLSLGGVLILIFQTGLHTYFRAWSRKSSNSLSIPSIKPVFYFVCFPGVISLKNRILINLLRCFHLTLIKDHCSRQTLSLLAWLLASQLGRQSYAKMISSCKRHSLKIYRRVNIYSETWTI